MGTNKLQPWQWIFSFQDELVTTSHLLPSFLQPTLQATSRLSGWHCRRSRVAEKPASLWLLSSRNWWFAGSWRTTSASTTRTTTVWRVSSGSDPPNWSLCHFGIHTCVCFSNLSGAYEWAQKTLKDHAKDKREYIYTREQLEKATTHDKLWNAAQVSALSSCCCVASSFSFCVQAWIDGCIDRQWIKPSKTLLIWSVFWSQIQTLLVLFCDSEAFS